MNPGSLLRGYFITIRSASWIRNRIDANHHQLELVIMSTFKQKHEESDDESGVDRKILMAVDFGTTFSGLAWSQTRRVSTNISLLSTELISICSRKSKRLLYAGPMPSLGLWKALLVKKCQRKLRISFVHCAEDFY